MIITIIKIVNNIKKDNYQFRNINYQLTIIRLSIKNNEIINETQSNYQFKNIICNYNLSRRGTTLLPGTNSQSVKISLK